MSAQAAAVEGPGGHAAESGQVSIYHDSMLRSPVFLGMVMFLGSEIMLFGSFFTSFFYIRFTHHPWPPPGLDIPKKPTGINTAILISSSFTMHWALVSIKKGNRFGLRAGMLTTFLLGLTFLTIQVNEYIHIGFAPHDAAQASVFYALTGLHGAHVFIGLCILAMVTIRAFRGHYSPEHHEGMEVPGIYWHFVDIMWVIVYTTVYVL